MSNRRDRTPPTSTSGGQSSGQLSAPTPRRRRPPPPPPLPPQARPGSYASPHASSHQQQQWNSNGLGVTAPHPSQGRNVQGHINSPIRRSPQHPQSQQHVIRTPPLIDEHDYDNTKKEAPPSTSSTSLPAGEPSGSSSSIHTTNSMGRPITSSSQMSSNNAAPSTPMTAGPRSILRTPSSSAATSSGNMSISGHSNTSTAGQSILSSHHSVSHHSAQTAPPVVAPTHRQSAALQSSQMHTPMQPDYTAPLRDAATAAAHGAGRHAAISGGSGSGLRSRTRSRSPGALVGGGGSGSESVAIGIDESTGSGRMRHWKKMSSLCEEGDAIRVDDHGHDNGHDNALGPDKGYTKTTSALKRATKATISSSSKRRTSGDRLPLYHPSQRMGQQAYTNTPYHAHAHAHAHHQGGPAPAVSMAPSWLAHSAFLLVILYVMLDSKAKVDRSTAQLRYYREEESRVNAKIAEFEERARQLSIETERLRRDNEALEELKAEQLAKLAKLDDEEGMVAAIEKERTKMLHRDSIIRNQMQILQERIQIESRREAAEKFGSEKQIVEVDLIFPESAPTHDEETGRPFSTKFHIEMASLADMPHTVQLFLEQVHHGLWDGCAFVWNPDHLVLASPHVHAEEVIDEDTDEARLELFEDDDKREDFVESGYTSVSFQEYSPNFPHRQYTLGYAGRPGGPNFYINMKDNTRVHGPQLDLKEGDEIDADPAFGKVVAGFDTVNRMHNMPTKVGGTGWHKDSFENDIIIRYAKILPQKPEQIE